MLSKIRKLLPQNQFLRGVGVLVGGTASSQLLMVMVAPLLTRLYSPEDYGLLAVYAGLLGLFSVVASLRYEIAIPQPEDDSAAINIMALSLILVVFSTAMLSLVLYLYVDQLVVFFHVEPLQDYLWLLPVGVFFFGFYQVFYYWGLRKKNFKNIAVTTLQQSLSIVAVQVLAHKSGVSALISGHVLGQVIGCRSLASTVFRESLLKQVSWQGMLQQASRFRNYPLFSSWSGLVNTMGSQLPSLMLAALFTPAAAGLYALSMRVIALPMSMIGGAVGNVFLPSAAKAYREGELGPLVINTHRALSNIGMPITCILLVAAPQLFSLVFGEQWQPAGVIAQWLAPMLYMIFVTSPMSTLFGIMDKQAQGLIFQIALLAGRVAGLTLGALYYNSIIVAAALFSIASCVCYFGFIVWIFIRSGNSLVEFFLSTVHAALLAGIMAMPLLVGVCFYSESLLWLVFLAVSCFFVGLRFFKLFKEVYI